MTQHNTITAAARTFLVTAFVLTFVLSAVARQPIEAVAGEIPAGLANVPQAMNDVTLTLVNRLSVPVRYYWVEDNGRESMYGTIDARGSVNQGTYATHRWRIKLVNGTYVGEFVASGQAAQTIEVVSKTVGAGPIWNQQDAVVKCNRLARSQGGAWTGAWWTTVPGQMSVCEIGQVSVMPPKPNDVELNIYNGTSVSVLYFWVEDNGKENLYGTIGSKGSVGQNTYPTHRWRIKLGNGTTVGDFLAADRRRQSIQVIGEAVGAGPIWNQQDAVNKCNALARQRGAAWTGAWWTTVQGQMSVCELARLSF